MNYIKSILPYYDYFEAPPQYFTHVYMSWAMILHDGVQASVWSNLAKRRDPRSNAQRLSVISQQS